MSISRIIVIGALGLAAMSPAVAQVSGLGSAGKALGGLAGGGLPNLSSMPAGNAAGVLSYCVKNKLVSSASANPTLGALTSKTGVTGSKDFSLGESGKILTGENKSLSLAGAQDSLKGKLCNMVLKQAKTFL